MECETKNSPYCLKHETQYLKEYQIEYVDTTVRSIINKIENEVKLKKIKTVKARITHKKENILSVLSVSTFITWSKELNTYMFTLEALEIMQSSLISIENEIPVR